VHRDIIPHHGGGACDIWEVACVGANQDTDIVERAGMVDQDDDRSYMEFCDRGSSCFDRMVAELCIDVGDGQVVVTTDNTFEFHDCLPISIDDMKYVIEEAEAFVVYRDGRNSSTRRQ
jgi:hypothetical protein